MAEIYNDLPAVVIVGRPNVGKSTLFNAILGERKSIVGDEPGITRDRIQGQARHEDIQFVLIDTGGIIPDDDALIPTGIFKQARYALERASHIIFVVDGRAEITGVDRDLARMLRQLNKPVALAVNKVDHPNREVIAHEFWALGFEHLFPVSAEHRLGLYDLLEHATKGFPEAVQRERPADRPIRVAIIGRPNAGKSTLLNALLGEDRAIVSPIPGTTRDSVDETVERDGRQYTFVDTAGIRRKGKTKLVAEKLAVMMARRHIDDADVVLMMIDALEGPAAQDATIAGYAHEAGRPTVICVNKWDVIEDKRHKPFEERVRDEMKFLDYAPVVFISALTGTGVSRILKAVREGYEAAIQRVGTGELNRFVEFLKNDTDIKLKYITQAGVRPPVFVLFAERGAELHFSTERYLINQIRKRFHFGGTPLVVKLKKDDPKGRKENRLA